jgi:mannose-6-phosphate isomerase
LGTRSTARYSLKVPLLAKFLDAAEPLSVQVHPDDAYAAAREAASGHLGKAEAWLVLEAERGSSVVWGFSRPVTKGEVRARATAGTLEEVLNVVPVSPGDVIYNPAGTVHAVGAGLLIFEIQQASDLTYRLYDYGRTDAGGQPRELHLDKALDVLELGREGQPKLRPRHTGEGVAELARTPHFLMERLEVSGEMSAQTGGETLHLLTVLAGEPVLDWEGGRLELSPAASVVVPAALGAYRLVGEGTLVRCSLPE